MNEQGRNSRLETEIRHNPKDWQAWLVFADLLIEADDARGQLIVLEHQRQTRTLSPEKDAVIAGELSTLTKAHQRGWKPRKLAKGCQLEWRFGFITAATFPLAVATIPSLEALLSHPSARVLGELRLREMSGRDDSDDFEDEESDFDETEDQRVPFSLEAVTGLLDLPLPPIRSLAIEYAPLPTEAVERLTSASSLASLVALDLRYTQLGDDGAAALTKRSALDSLRELRLQNNAIGPAGVEKIAESFSNLELLDLRDNSIEQRGARAVARLWHLESLLLHLDDIGRDGALELAQSKHLGSKTRRLWAARGGASR